MGVRFLRDIGLGAGSCSGGHGRQILWAPYQDLPMIGPWRCTKHTKGDTGLPDPSLVGLSPNGQNPPCSWLRIARETGFGLTKCPHTVDQWRDMWKAKQKDKHNGDPCKTGAEKWFANARTMCDAMPVMHGEW